ncbi:shikimate kinase [Pirellulaceae bacterium]|jgi:shikimate kinase|nr:shikimate kinase [bacterium]MDB4640629.1 shikimate kinase [Pirellulaceae bacterium]
MIISLIGYRGTGKSTVGKLVAEQLKIQHLDSDNEIVHRAKHSIKEIFESIGELGFRDLESEIVANLMTQSNAVISWGGGVILREKNRKLIRKSDHVFWLTANPVILNQRINADAGSALNRPALSNLVGIEEIKSILDQRIPLYDDCASVQIATDSKPVDSIAKEIVSFVNA